MVPMPTGTRTSTGVLFALCSIFIVQIGAAASTAMFAAIAPAGTAWLRLCWAGLIFVLVATPRVATFHRRDLTAALALGVVSGGMTPPFFEAIDPMRIAPARP